jgi:hypothetical protein
MTRTTRTLPKSLTLDNDPQIFKSFERNKVQVLAGGPISELIGWGSAALDFEGDTKNSATTLKNLGYQCGYQSIESQIKKEKP